MKNIHRIGNEFWIEGDWHYAASVDVLDKWDRRTDKTTIRFEVSYGTRASDIPDEVEPYAQAILAACNYARLCEELFKGKDYPYIRDYWHQEKVENSHLLKQWEEDRKKRKS